MTERIIDEVYQRSFSAKALTGTAMVHDLKIWPQFFDAVASGRKPFELRRNDRDFKVGDVLSLQVWDPVTKQYDGRRCQKVVTYLMSGPFPGFADIGLAEGYVIMGLKEAD